MGWEALFVEAEERALCVNPQGADRLLAALIKHHSDLAPLHLATDAAESPPEPELEAAPEPVATLPPPPIPFSPGRPPEGPPSLQRIIEEVAVKHEVPISNLVGRNRAHPIVMARHEYFYRASAETAHSYPRIGAVLGSKDHTTVLYGINRYAIRENKPHPRMSIKNRCISCGADYIAKY